MLARLWIVAPIALPISHAHATSSGGGDPCLFHPTIGDCSQIPVPVDDYAFTTGLSSVTIDVTLNDLKDQNNNPVVPDPQAVVILNGPQDGNAFVNVAGSAALIEYSPSGQDACTNPVQTIEYTYCVEANGCDNPPRGTLYITVDCEDPVSCNLERVSTHWQTGVESDGVTRTSSLSSSGRYIAFSSTGNGMVPGDSNTAGPEGADVFWRDRWTAETRLVSVNSTGAQGQGQSKAPAISGDGNLVAFTSKVNLSQEPPPTADWQVWLRDIAAGTTELVSRAHGANVPSNAPSGADSVSISADGAWIAFQSPASDILATDDGGGFIDVFLRDMSNPGSTTLRVSEIAGVAANGDSHQPSVSENGEWVAFVSRGSNLPGATGIDQVYLWERATGAITHVSKNIADESFDDRSILPWISSNGAVIAYTSLANNFSGPVDTQWDIMVYDHVSNVRERATNPVGETGLGSVNPSVSDDGRFLAFRSDSHSILPGSGVPAGSGIYVRDLASNSLMYRISDAPDGTLGDNDSWIARVSGNGRYVGFGSMSTNLLPHDSFDPLADPPVNSFDLYVWGRPRPWIEALCFGDGSGTACPCNAGGNCAGCDNSFETGGALLFGHGDSHLFDDSLVLRASGLSNSAPCLFFQGTDIVTTGFDDGSVFGNGLRCVGGSVTRLGTKNSSGTLATFGAGVPGDPLISVKGNVAVGNVDRYYQVWYRNLDNDCTSSGFNLSNALRVTWLP